jgi:hypothetical protein
MGVLEVGGGIEVRGPRPPRDHYHVQPSKLDTIMIKHVVSVY